VNDFLPVEVVTSSLDFAWWVLPHWRQGSELAKLVLLNLMVYWTLSGCRNQTGLRLQMKVWIFHPHRRHQTDDAKIVNCWVCLDKLIQARPSYTFNEKKGDPLRWSSVWCRPRSLWW